MTRKSESMGVTRRLLSSSARAALGRPAAPSVANSWHRDHVQLLASSLHRLTGRSFLPPDGVTDAAARDLADNADLIVISHGIEEDPLFNYCTRAGLELWEVSWEQLVSLPSKRSAEQVERSERAELLARVQRDGYIADYSGVRVSSTGRRFRIHGATVWEVYCPDGVRRGQACTFARSTVERLD